MNHPHLDQAREWARDNIDDFYEGERFYAVCEIIQSLPDHWIDAEKVREVIERTPIDPQSTALDPLIKDLRALLTPPLPTLADMTPEEREACRWMQAQTWHEVGIIVWVDEMTEIAQLIARENGVLERKFKDIAPLPGEPRLKWPGSVEDASAVDDEPIMMPRPEDVPAGKVWVVQYDGEEWIGCRNDPGTRLPWLVLRRDEHQFDYCYDTDITLVSRLVREVPRG